MPETQIKIEIVWRALKDFVRQQKEGGMEFTHRNYIRKRGEIQEAPNGMRLRLDVMSPLEETEDPNNSDLYGFSEISNKIRIVGT